MLFQLYWLLVAHALADFPLQGDWLSKAKNHALSPVREKGAWALHLSYHALIHSAGVYVVTGWASLAVLEFMLHWVIDYIKSDGRISYVEDQGAHITCKVFYVVFIAVWEGIAVWLG